MAYPPPTVERKVHFYRGEMLDNDGETYVALCLRETGAKVKFLSCEPLLGPLPDLDLEDIDWMIVGGESGPGARPMDPAWVTDLRDQCLGAEVPFFFKQWGGQNKKKAGRLLEGRVWGEVPRIAAAAG